MIMISAFATLRLSLFAFSQQLRFASSEFIMGSRSARVRPGMLILVSSANIFAQAVVRQFGRSFNSYSAKASAISPDRGRIEAVGRVG